jgi:hypothetical protein
MSTTTTPAVQSTSFTNTASVNNTSNISQNGMTTTPNVNTTTTTPNVNTTTTHAVNTSTFSSSDVGEPGAFLKSLQDYLVNSPLLQNNNGDNDNVAEQIQDINKSMNSVAAAISSNNSANILSQQMGMQTIIDQEMNRLEQKQQNIEGAVTTQQRMMVLNDSFLKRQQMFSKMAVAIVIGMSLIFIFRYFSINNPDLEGLANVLSIFVIVSVFFYSMWTYVAIISRDPIYFDQLKYIPDKLTPAPTSSVVYSSGYGGTGSSQQFNPNQCIGSDCCSVANGSVWDSSSNSCVANATK